MNASTLFIAPRLRAPRGGLAVGDRQYRGGVFLPPSARPILAAAAGKAARASIGDPVVIGINGFDYRVESISIAASVGTVAYLVIPKDKPTQSYHVHHSNEGETCCSCADWEFRRKGSGTDCKHGVRLAELGLIPSTRPRVLPPLAGRAPLPRPWEAPTPTYGSRFTPSPAEEAEAARLLGRA